MEVKGSVKNQQQQQQQSSHPHDASAHPSHRPAPRTRQPFVLSPSDAKEISAAFEMFAPVDSDGISISQFIVAMKTLGYAGNKTQAVEMLTAFQELQISYQKSFASKNANDKGDLRKLPFPVFLQIVSDRKEDAFNQIQMHDCFDLFTTANPQRVIPKLAEPAHLHHPKSPKTFQDKKNSKAEEALGIESLASTLSIPASPVPATIDPRDVITVADIKFIAKAVSMDLGSEDITAMLEEVKAGPNGWIEREEFIRMLRRTDIWSKHRHF